MRYSKKYIEEIKERIPEAAFKLFSKQGIVPVTMEAVANEAGVGVATLYRYYGTKLNLVVEVGAAKWNKVANEIDDIYKSVNGEKFTAREELEFYLETYIYIFENYKDLLIFNASFDTFVMYKNASTEELATYLEVIKAFQQQFNQGFRKAFKDHTIRTDLPEEQVYFGFMYSMLSIITKYAKGIVYPDEIQIDCIKSIRMQIEACLAYMAPENEKSRLED